MLTLFRVFSFPLAYSVKDFRHPPSLSCDSSYNSSPRDGNTQ